MIFCLEDLSIFDSGVLKSPSVSVLLSISFLKSSKIFLIYLGASMLDAYMFAMFMSSWQILMLGILKCISVSLVMTFVLKSILSDISIATPVFFFLVYLLEIFFSNPSLSVCVGGSQRRVSCKQHNVGHVFLSIQLPYVFWLEHFIH